MTTTPPNNSAIPHTAIAQALSSPVRWAILATLVENEVLPASQLAKNVGVTPSALTKHLANLRRHGLIEHWHRKLYRIPKRFRIPGENALDFGSALIRLDGVK